MSVSTENNMESGEIAPESSTPTTVLPSSGLPSSGLSGSGLPKLGEMLREKREDMQLTVDDVSNRLRLSVRQIQALEGNNFTVFPEPMMTRGFIRNYARLLELDSEPLLSAYRSHVPNVAPHAISIHSANVQLPNGSHRSWGKYWSLLGLVLLMAVAYFGYIEYTSWHKAVPAADISQIPHTEAPTDDTAEAAAGNSVTSAQPMPEAALPLAERQAEADTSAAGAALPTNSAATTNSTTANSTVTATNPVIDNPPATSPAAANIGNNSSSIATKAPEELAQATAAPAVVKVKQATTMPLLKLQFVLNEPCWVSVVDRDGKQVINKTAAAGSREEVEAYPPLKVIIGNASASQLIFQGKVIDLVPYTRLNVARLTLALE